MDEINVLAVVGSCAPERFRHAARLASAAGRVFFPAQRLGLAADPIQEALALIPWTDRPAGAVCEFPTATHPTEIIGAFADEPTRVSLRGIVCVADAMHLLSDLQRDQYLTRTEVLPDGVVTEYRAQAMLTVTQLEFASMVVLVNWEGLSTPDLSTVMALVSHLSPQARLRLDHGGVELPDTRQQYEASQDRPGWVSILNGEHDPHMTDLRVTGFRYEQLKPLHPERLQVLLNERIAPGEFGTVVRSAGMCRLATRPGVVGEWEHVGQVFSLEPLEADVAMLADLDEGSQDSGRDILALGQDLAFIGLDLDATALSEALDDAALSDDEVAAGPAAWAQYHDPFPAWQGIAEHSE
ncbi:hypothetical protein G7067_05830 [Leucobacter insecticola]|uniref:CobW C-terminal domain-containing protein n=1 Tax=Leucobacter insecticola TaxID=2714934 RepID=A0A6G8FLP5_9MICO|nr:hypothetical protein G7067_05830 [Leucobacter insecticola]